MYQSIALYNYVASTYGFMPGDAMDRYKGEMLYEALVVDTFFKKIGPIIGGLLDKLFFTEFEKRSSNYYHHYDQND